MSGHSGTTQEDVGNRLIVLAGGKRKVPVDGCSIPKVLAPVMRDGRSTLGCVLDSAAKARFRQPHLVTRAQCNGAFDAAARARAGLTCNIVAQYDEGTAQALQLALDEGGLCTSATAAVVVFASMPLVRDVTIKEMLSNHYANRDLMTVSVCDLALGDIDPLIRVQLERRARVVTKDGKVTHVVLPGEPDFAGLRIAMIAPYVVRLRDFKALRDQGKIGGGPFLTDLVRQLARLRSNHVGFSHVPAGELVQFKGDPKVDPKNGYPQDIFGKLGSTPRPARNTRTKVCA